MKKVLLLQFRSKTDKSIKNEIDCYLRIIPKEIFEVKNTTLSHFNSETILKKIDGYKAVILGGSAEFYLSRLKEDKKLQNVLGRIEKMIKFLIAKDFPTLGVCFGHQLLGYFLGSKVEQDTAQAESGTVRTYLTGIGRKDRIFKEFPDSFYVQTAHKDSVINLPQKAVRLAFSDRCRNFAFRFKKNVYGVQFHPEILKKDLIYRLKLNPSYKSKNTLINIKATPYAQKVIKNFLHSLD